MISSIFLLAATALLSPSALAGQLRTAQAIITPDSTNPLGKNVSGSVKFGQLKRKKIVIKLNINGLVPNSIHGLHVHGQVIQDQNCTTAGPHYNPLNATHGAPTNNATQRHYGDLGNFQANEQGIIKAIIKDSLLSFYGNFPMKNNTLSFVIHEKQDDLGLGNNADSLKTGNAGSRLACGNINFPKKI